MTNITIFDKYSPEVESCVMCTNLSFFFVESIHHLQQASHKQATSSLLSQG